MNKYRGRPPSQSGSESLGLQDEAAGLVQPEEMAFGFLPAAPQDLTGGQQEDGTGVFTLRM